MIDDDLVRAHRARALDPEHRSSAAPRRTRTRSFRRARRSTRSTRACRHRGRRDGRFAALTGRQYHLFDYDGAPDAERVVVLMGSGAETARETVKALCARGEKVGVLQVRLYRPFAADAFPRTRCPQRCAPSPCSNRPRSPAPPASRSIWTSSPTLAQALRQRRSGASMPRVIGGRYGLSSKDFTPAMAKAVFDELQARQPAVRTNSFTVGIDDDVSHTSLPSIQLHDRTDRGHRAVFYGLGADGTVGANKNTREDHRRGRRTLRPGLFRLRFAQIRRADDLASALRARADPRTLPDRLGQLRGLPPVRFSRAARHAARGRARRGVPAQQPLRPRRGLGPTARSVQQQIIDKKLRFFVIDASSVARESGLGTRINTDPADLLLRDLWRAAARRRRCGTSRTRSRRATAERARRWSQRISPRSTPPWRICHEVSVPANRDQRSEICRRSSRLARPTSCSASPR